MTTTAAQFIGALALDLIAPSPFNPRRNIDEAALRELGATLKVQQLQPIAVRQLDKPRGKARYELIAGHRRVAAAKLVGLKALEAVIRTASDSELQVAHMVENLQREALAYLEEAEGYARLRDAEGLTGKEIAARVGKKPGTVFARMKLLELVPEGRKALESGAIPVDIGLLIARIPVPELQRQALAQCKELRAVERGTAGVRTLRDLIVEKFTLDLGKAIFDTKSADLLPGAGACTSCPKRTGGDVDLFGDLIKGGEDRFHYVRKKGPNLCTDPECFAAKKAEHLAIEADKLQAKGKRLVTGSAARAAISADGQVKGAYIELAAVRDELAKVKAKDPEATIEVVTIQDPRTGKTKQAVKREELKAAGIKPESAERDGPSRSYAALQAKHDEERRQKEKKAEAEAQARRQQFEALRATYTAAPRSVADLQLIALHVVDSMPFDAGRLLLQLRGWKNEADAHRAIHAMSADELATLLLDCALVPDLIVRTWNMQPAKSLKAAAAIYAQPAPTPTELRARGEVGRADEEQPKPEPKPKRAARAKPRKATKTAPAHAGDGDESEAAAASARNEATAEARAEQEQEPAPAAAGDEDAPPPERDAHTAELFAEEGEQ